ncbi:MAG: DUF1573 domain-containing protein [Polaribacter sp.]
MEKLTLLCAFLVTTTIMISCGNTGNAANKINKENLNSAMTRDAEIKKSTTSLSFDKKEFNFGTVNEGDIVETDFVLTNTGKTDLVITNAIGSCGCTVPTWPKEPIKPGETGDIKVKFNTSGKPNRQMKTVTLTTNTESGRQVLTIKGSVIPKAKK